jgi:hypothetical protein
MPEPIPAVIDYRVEEITFRPTLDEWGIRKDCPSALFLCRVTRVGNHTVDSIPISFFRYDSEGVRFAKDFLKQME